MVLAQETADAGMVSVVTGACWRLDLHWTLHGAQRGPGAGGRRAAF